MPRLREIANHYGVNGTPATRKEIATLLKKAESTLVYFFSSVTQYGLLKQVGKGFVVSSLYDKMEAPVYGEQESKAAKIEAFGNVPLYKKIIDAKNNSILPNEAGLINLFKSKEFGINHGTAAKAVKTFFENAFALGLVDTATNRFTYILPKINNGSGAERKPEKNNNNNTDYVPPSINNTEDKYAGLEEVSVPFGKAGDMRKGYFLLPSDYSNKDLKRMSKLLKALEFDEDEESNTNKNENE